MPQDLFTALVLDQPEGALQASIRELPRDALPEGDVLVAVAYSSLNYKDGLAVSGQGKVVRSPYPFVPGIDLAGTVVESQSPAFAPGDEVVLTGWGVGERHWGGYGQLARVRAEWLVPLPAGMSLRHAMAIGTAGLTAMLCVMALEERGLAPGGREVVVSGAAGGVGSIAVAVLARLGYAVAASTGRAESHAYLSALGAGQILDREALTASAGKPLASERWGGAVDTVGGATLAGLLPTMAYGSSIAACGNAGGQALNTTVFPLILRAVSLLGIDSVMCPLERRRVAWARLAADLPAGSIEQMSRVVPLREVPELSRAILQGQVRGRVVVDVNA